ncbi:MAG: domain S-box, partial [Phycisphaerales bacterium]|nr:domain S-box [Phycisphaerales bacterium]
STIEELQTSNEEMKASNEEVSSVNEELQSTNEELETSKEELQSLNEELSTVNAQLTSKMEELERITNDLSSLLSSTDIAVLFLDTQLRIRRFTPAMKYLIDLIPSDAGRPLSDMAHKFRDPQLPADAESVLEKLVPIEREVVADGGQWYARRVLPYRTTDNRIEGVVVTFVDITARRAAETSLRQSEEQYRMMVEGVRDHAIFQTDLSGRIISWNAAAERVLGFSQAEAIGESVSIIFTPEDRASGADQLEMKTALIKGRAIDERWHVRRDGSRLWGSGTLTLLTDEADQPRGFVKVMRDATARRLAEMAQAESEARFRAVADIVPDLLWENDTLGRASWQNRRWYDFTGQSPEQAAGRGWADVIHPEDRAQSLVQFQTALDNGQDYRCEQRLRSRDGQYRWFLSQACPMRDEAGAVLRWFGAATDIHEHRISLDALRESEERFRLAIEAANMGFWDWDVVNDTVNWDPSHNRLLGLPEDQSVGNEAQFLERVHPDDRDRVTLALRAVLERRADYNVEFRAVHPDGSVRWVAGYGRSFGSQKGRVTRIIGAVLDITHRKLVEQERVSLYESEKAARALAESANNIKDQFLANASHELRTPLSAILLWSNLLQGNSADETMRREGLAAIEHSAKSQQRLIEDLMDTARISAGKVRLDIKPVDLASRVTAAIETVRPAAQSKGVELKIDIGDDIGHALADADRVEQIVWNLVSNGVKFTPVGGWVEIRVRRKGRQVEIRISDTGQGIAPELLPDVFARFRQGDPSNTRRHGGLGLGLAISRQLAELHGGTIEVTSEGTNKGSTFTVKLPLPKRVGATADPDPEAAIVPGGSLGGVRILLVEDDVKTREGLARLLTNAGAAVEPVGHVDEAIAAIVRERPDIIVSDIGLPDRDGHAFLRQLRSDSELNSPRLPAVALSAFNRPQDRSRAIESGFDEYLSKPVQPPLLVGLMRKLLGME